MLILKSQAAMVVAASIIHHCRTSLKSSRQQQQQVPLTTTKTTLVFLFVFLPSLFQTCSAIVFFRGKSFAISFDDVHSKFALPVNGSGICGALYVADPYDACSSLQNGLSIGEAESLRFALIARGTCSFDEKVRNAQAGGFHAAIVYDNRDKDSLISMVSNSQGIRVHAVFISKAAGETLKKFAQGEAGECCISSSSEDATWTVLAISLISLQFIMAILGIIFVARNHWLRQYQQQQHQQGTDQTPAEESMLMKVLPSFTFNTACLNGKCTSETCSICLEDYKSGESLRALPCEHECHVACVDSWLIRRKFCPVCKHDVSMDKIEYSVCESTPLLSHSMPGHPITAAAALSGLST